MSNTCLAKSLVYKAEVSTDKDNAKVYIGVTANSFKERFRNHTKSIKNERHGNETELSKYIWKLKRAKRSYDIKWSNAYPHAKLVPENAISVLKKSF